MKKRWFFVILGVLILLLVPLAGCIEDTGSKTPAQVPVVVTVTDQQQNAKIEAVEKKNSDQDTKISELTGKVAAIPAQGASQAALDAANAKISNLESAKADMLSKIAALETKVSQWTNPVPGQPAPPVGSPTGIVTYTIMPQSYQFSSSQVNGAFTIRIYNGTSVSRWVRPQILFTAWGSQSVVIGAGGLVAPFGMTTSSNMGTAIIWQYVPNAAGNTTTTIMAIATSGALQNGEYMVGPGTSIDVYVSLTGPMNVTPAVIWNITVSGSDRTM